MLGPFFCPTSSDICPEQSLLLFLNITVYISILCICGGVYIFGIMLQEYMVFVTTKVITRSL